MGNGLSVLDIITIFEASFLEECPKFDLLILLSFHLYVEIQLSEFSKTLLYRVLRSW